MKIQKTKRRIQPKDTPEATQPTAALEAPGGPAAAEIIDPPDQTPRLSSAMTFADTGGTHLTALDDW